MIGNIVEKQCIEIILQQKGEIKISPFFLINLIVYAMTI